MASEATALDFNKREPLTDAHVYQTDDGTIFYHQYHASPQRLCVKQRGKQIEAKLPHGDIQSMATHDNALYFEANGKVYKASFNSPNSIAIECLRPLHEDELVHSGALCSRVRDGVKYVYRMGDDPDRSGIRIDLIDNELRGLELSGIHRSRAIYVGYFPKLAAHNLSENVVVIQVPRQGDASIYCRESSSLIFIANGPSLFTLNVESMIFLPPLHFRQWVWIHSIAGIRYDFITLGVHESDKFYMMTAQLPKRYTEEKHPIPLARRIQRMDRRLSERNSDLFDSPILLSHGSSAPTQLCSRLKELKAIYEETVSMQKNDSRNGRSESASVPILRLSDNWLMPTPIGSQIEENAALHGFTQQRLVELDEEDQSDQVDNVLGKVHSEKSDEKCENLRQELQRKQLQIRQTEERLCDALSEIIERERENKQILLHVQDLTKILSQNSLRALQLANQSLQFSDLEKFTKPLVCCQLENGTLLYFDNTKPFELFTMQQSVVTFDMQIPMKQSVLA